jgi:hypothetical protein
MTALPRRWPAWVLALLAVAVLLPMGQALAYSTSAENAPAFSITPVGQSGSYFDLRLDAGSVTDLAVVLGNDGEEPATVTTYAAGVYTLVNGGFGVLAPDALATGPAAWLDYAPDTLTLDAKQQIERAFTLRVPEGTAPGQYIAALVVQTAEPIAVSGSDMLRQNIVKAIAVFVTVPGSVTPKLAIGAAAYASSDSITTLSIEVRNEGNVLLKPSGTVIVTAANGSVILNAPVEMGSVYAGMATTIELPVPTALPPGTYTVSVDLADADTGATAAADALPLTIAAPEATPVAPAIAIASVTIDPITGADNALQVVNATVTLTNSGPALAGARLTLHVERDGVLVEDYPLNASLTIPTGETPITARYAPIAGWQPGTYTFSVKLEAVDLTSGQTTTLATADAPAPIVVA